MSTHYRRGEHRPSLSDRQATKSGVHSAQSVCSAWIRESPALCRSTSCQKAGEAMPCVATNPAAQHAGHHYSEPALPPIALLLRLPHLPHRQSLLSVAKPSRHRFCAVKMCCSPETARPENIPERICLFTTALAMTEGINFPQKVFAIQLQFPLFSGICNPPSCRVW